MNNTVENIHEENLTYSEPEQIADKIAEKIAKELNDFVVKPYVFNSRIEIQIGKLFAEISDSVSEIVDEYVKKDIIDEDGAEELFDEIFEEELYWINEECTVNISGKIETEKYIVYFRPSKCGGDYCIAGLEVEIEFRDKVTDIDIGKIAQLIITVFRLFRL
jgi:hypothetical protein